MKDPGFQKLYEELRLGAPRGSRHALAVLMRSGVAAWMTLLSARGSDTAHRRRAPIGRSAPAARHELVQVLTAMVTGYLQGANP